MYVTFLDYFFPGDDPENFINNSFDHHASSEFADELYSRNRLIFNDITRHDDTVTIWLRQSGRDTMAETMSDLMTVLDARECVDWSKIPRDCGGTLHG